MRLLSQPYLADGAIAICLRVMPPLVNRRTFGREQILQHGISVITYDGFIHVHTNLVVVYT
jgi:hypothetical protein